MSNDPYEDLNDWLSGPDTCAPPDEPDYPDDDYDAEEAEFQRQEREATQAVANLRVLFAASASMARVHCGSLIRTPRP